MNRRHASSPPPLSRLPLPPLAAALLLLLLLALAFYAWLSADLPSPDDLSRYTAAPSSKVYDRHGRLLFELPPPYTGFHTPLPLAQIPPALQQATIAAEDANFYRHPGVDPVAVVRAAWYILQGREVGGSTLTQQLVRLLMLSPTERLERTPRRKLREMLLALRLTQRYSKDQILEFYLNEAYYGHLAYGVEAAAQTYFGKSARDLDLAECALLAGLPQAPALYNPLENPTAARERQAVVLDLMVKQGYLTAEQARLAKEEPLYFAPAEFAIRAPHFVMLVRAQLEEELGLARLQAGGLSITTTLDVDLNDTALALMQLHLERLATCQGEATCPPGGHNVRNAAVVALNPQTGELLALVGSPDYFSAAISGAVNGATALRQPGSAIKPLTYAAALERGDFTPATLFWDVRTAFVTREGQPYVPHNYDLEFHGPVRLREALGSSYNLIAVKVLDTIGLEALMEMARRLGITPWERPDRLGLATTLGGGEVRLLELTAAYAAFANGGYRLRPLLISQVTDATGAVIHGSWEQAGRGEQVLDPRVAYLITDILSDDQARLPTFGEGSVLRLTRPAAVKTGTTTYFRDNWTIGYTPDLIVGVWAGNADNEPMRDVSGVDGAAPLWHAIMETALKGRPVQEFPRPEGIVEREICALSGQLPGPACPHRITERFIAGTEPTQTCTLHQRIGDRVYLAVPPEAQSWARAQGWPLLPETAVQPATTVLALESPDQGATYRIDPTLPPATQQLEIAAHADGLITVTLLADGEPLATFSAPPYRVLWPLKPGVHRFWAEGTDAAGTLVVSPVVQIAVSSEE